MAQPNNDNAWDLRNLLRGVGIKPNSLYKLRFGGVVGKIAILGTAPLVPIAIIAARANATAILWACIVGALLLPFYGIGAALFFAHRHPLEATLEGSEVVALVQAQTQLVAKGHPEIPHEPPVLRSLDVRAIERPNEGETT